MVQELLQKAVALAGKVRAICAEVVSRHIQRSDVVKATWLSLVAGHPCFFLGPPGVDKTGTIQDIVNWVDGETFYDVLMPTVGGGKQIRASDKLGRAALAHLVFADEIWKAEPRVLQTLLDLAKGDGVRHEGMLVKTPLLAFLAASNELPEPEGNLGAVWSRMTIRVVVQPLDRAGKKELVAARLLRDRDTKQINGAESMTLADIDLLRQSRPLVEVPDEIVNIALDILQELIDDQSADFAWAWADNRRFGRLFDVMQANALLDGRTTIAKQDLAVLEWLLWDTPEQIAVVRAKLAPYCRTPLSDATEVMDALLAPGESSR